MTETWKRWEGQVVNGEFPLQRFLGGSDHSAVFLSQKGAGSDQKIAIKFIPADADDAAKLRQWKVAAELDHPNLIHIFEAGRCELGDGSFLYAVMEYAEENLAQILPERALTPAEAQEMLKAVLQALAYVHAKGMVHGQVKPSNILAVGDNVKLSSDALRARGEPGRRPVEKSVYDAPEAALELAPSSDVWSLGVTLVEALTQRRPVWNPAAVEHPSLPEEMPEPFRETARNCLRVEPHKRWTVAEIAARLESSSFESRSKSPSESAQPKPRQSLPVPVPARSEPAGTTGQSSKWPYVLALFAAGVVAVVLMVRSNTSHAPGEVPPMQAPIQQEPKPSPGTPAGAESGRGASEDASTSAPVSSSESKTAGEKTEASGTNLAKGAVLHPVLPNVSPSARHTITGKIKVRVKVEVDAAGNVAKATLVSPGPSQYFARMAMEAARDWKFKPAEKNGQVVASEWTLQFAFSRSGTEVSPLRTAP